MRNKRIDGIERRRLVPQPDEDIFKKTEIDGRKDTYKVGIPHSDRILHADFPHQKAIHPSKSKLHEFYIL
jgi:hypothetical protein